MANLNYQYKKNAANSLKKFNLVPQGFEPSSVSNGRSFIILSYNGIRAACEMKYEPTFVTFKLKYEETNKFKPWQFLYISPSDEEAVFAKNVIDDTGIFSRIRKFWTSEPLKGKYIPLMSEREKMEKDLENFKDVKGTIPISSLIEYYNKKESYYINFGTNGLFRLGERNPLRVQNVPLLNNFAEINYTARISKKLGYDYDFVLSFEMEILGNSPFNIAPAARNGAVSIDDTNLGPFSIDTDTEEEQ